MKTKITLFTAVPSEKYPELWENGWTVGIVRFLGIRFLKWIK